MQNYQYHLHHRLYKSPILVYYLRKFPRIFQDTIVIHLFSTESMAASTTISKIAYQQA